MNFSEFENLMKSLGFSSLAEIARATNASPQAVSNWKSRNQVPHHIIYKVNEQYKNVKINQENNQSAVIKNYKSNASNEISSIHLTDLILTLAEQLKVIFLTTFISIFLTYTYVQFIQQPKYNSWAKVLLPDNKKNNFGGIAGLASQFGVNMPMENAIDLSSPTIYPDLLSSRTFAEKILNRNFFLEKHNKKIPLIDILTSVEDSSNGNLEARISKAVTILNEDYFSFIQEPKSSFSVLMITAPEPMFAKELADVVLSELEALSRYYKTETVNQKTSFIRSRILSVENDLKLSEKALKDFNQRNRQISSPSLKLEFDRLERDVEVQVGIYLTLKQQFELAKIEEIQESSVVQILDRPQTPQSPSNKNLFFSLLLSILFGFGLGVFLSFLRAFINNKDKNERKKIRRVKHFIKKKTKEIFRDFRITGIISTLMLCGLPFYLGKSSKSPLLSGLISPEFLFIVTAYLTLLLIFTILFLKSIFTRKKEF